MGVFSVQQKGQGRRTREALPRPEVEEAHGGPRRPHGRRQAESAALDPMTPAPGACCTGRFSNRRVALTAHRERPAAAAIHVWGLTVGRPCVF